MTIATGSKPAGQWGRRLRRGLLIVAVLALVAFFLFTSGAPSVPARSAPTAEEVAAGRDAYRRIRMAKGSTVGTRVMLGPENFAGLGALASHAFRPNRLRIDVIGQELRVEGSRHLPLGRWLNVSLRASAPSRQFPATRLTIGAVTLPSWLSRPALEAGRLLLMVRGVEAPSLNQSVRDFAIVNGAVAASLRLPGKTGLIDEVGGVVALPVDAPAVGRIYCALTEEQGRAPSGDFATQVRRAFAVPANGVAPDTFNRAAFVALGVLLVDRRVAELAQVPDSELDGCRPQLLIATIHGRQDWTKHLTLSAALAAVSGTQLSQAAGEWKELADSLDRRSEFSTGDPTGFSMADLAADRAGLRTAQAALDPARAASLKVALARATSDQLLPPAAVASEDSLTNDQFVRQYGGLDDPRFAARVRVIDAELDGTGLR